MEDATQLQPMSHRHLVVVKSEPQESEDTANIIDQHEVNTETSDQPLKDFLIQPKIDISDDRELFHLQTESEKNPAFDCSHIGEGSGNEEHYAIQPFQEDAIEFKPQTIGETGFFHIQIKSEFDLELPSEENDPGQDPLNNSLVPPGDFLYSCVLCSYRSDSKYHFASHKLSHSLEKKQVAQSLTSIIIPSSSSKDKDYPTGPSQNTDPFVPRRGLIFSCKNCSYQSASRQDIDSHKSLHYAERQFHCCHCSFGTNFKASLVYHLRIHSGERPYACDKCTFAGATNSCLTKHKLRHISEKRHKCGECDFSTHSKQSLVNHLRTHSGERPYACDLCSYQSISSALLSSHIRRNHTAKSNKKTWEHRCNRCYFGTNVLDYLTIHNMVMHSEERPHACTLCSHKFITRNALTMHQKLHKSEKKYKCNQCDFCSDEKQIFDDHMGTHAGERPFACEFCSYICATSRSLSGHMRCHTAEKKRACANVTIKPTSNGSSTTI